MAGPASRVSKVVMTGPLAPFGGVYELELRRRCYTPLTSVVTVASGGATEPLAGDERAGGRRADRRPGRGVPRLPAGQRALPRSVVASGPAVSAGCAAGAGGARVEEPARAGSPAEAVLASFERYLLAERGLATGTVRGYVSHAGRFLDGLSPCGACRRDGGGRDAGGAARVRGGVGERDPVLRGGAAVVSALLRSSRDWRGGPVTGGAAGDRSAPLVAAAGDHYGRCQRAACLL